MHRHHVVCLALLAFAALFLAAGALAQPGRTCTYSPLTAVGVGPSGPATAKITVEPYCCPSTAVVVKAPTPVAESDFQWVNIGLTGPSDHAIEAVEVCYSLKVGREGATYISQTRLTEMTTPDAAHVKMDDGTDRKAPGPTCYRVPAELSPRGTVTLALKVVLGDSGDEIRIGMVKLYRSPARRGR